ncbi:DNA polymerase I [Pseudorhodoferax sp. Leaf267]|uniref:DNA polymerase I n=1 Tax=Pseudorhodoferax sp. Leaf267 TaxID=1736316 RepID=UPI0007010C62|nr:DNA polymerase I [Pseudorhodoferax sp. Leaf267]KQP23002.1 DNA polymerase I [Pseudorhodoferax sp. Leaf267]
MSDTNTLLLVDGSSYLYRAYHALPDLRGPDNFPTGALHGMVAMLTKLRAQFPSAHAVCVFDAPGKTFRDDLYADYKANRAAMPEPLAQQIAPIHEVVKLLGWPVLTIPGIEADDVIGTLARSMAARGGKVIVSTGDKDMAQLVDDKVTLINTMSNESLDPAGVQAKFGVPPERIVDYLSLIGDTVDNVPGVDKVGPKTASKWLAEHGSLDGVMAAAGSIKGVAGENLRKALDWLPMGRQLVTIRTDCDLAEHVAGWATEAPFDALKFAEPDPAHLLAFYTRYGFKTMARDLEARMAATKPAPASTDDLFAEGPGEADEPAATICEPAAPSGDYQTIATWDQFDAWLARLRAAPLAALDTETDSLDPMRARIVGISFALQTREAAYIPLAHNYADAPDQLPLNEVLARLKPWLEDEAAGKMGQNIKYDSHVFANHDIQVRGWRHDTLLQSYVLEAHKPHSLESLADRHLGRKGLSYEDICGKGAKQIPFAQVDVATATTYSGEDSEMVLDVHRVLWPELDAEPAAAPSRRYVYEQIEMPTSALLQRIERHGVLVDAEVLHKQSQALAERMIALEQQAYELAGQPFNMGSPKQIGEILFTKLGIPGQKKTASGAYSTDEEVLEKLAADHPLPARLLEHRSLSKLKGTYTDKLPLMVNPITGRVHTNYAQAVAVTGRLSSNEPNLQNIPIRTPEGRRVREAFIAPPGHRIASADYSQIELRIMAHISEDPGLLSAFAEGRDVHRATASEVFGVAVDEVSSEQRRYAKVINFGLIYGMGAFGLASNLGIDQKAAKTYIDRYFDRFAGVKRYMDETRAKAAATGYVETLFGRRIVLPEILGGSGPRRAGAERQAINAPMQGTAADLIKLAMIAVQAELDRAGKSTRIVMQVHDELVFELPEDEEDWVRTEVPRLMAGVAQLKVPLLAEVGVGANWDQAH